MSAGNFNTKITKSAEARIEELEALAGGDMDKKFGTKNWRYQLGTLGGGNHFIEICLDKENMIWLTLHSGSRGIGNRIGNHYIKLAQLLMGNMHILLPDRDLAYLPEETEEFHDYQRDLKWGQKFALLNREEMMDRFRHTFAQWMHVEPEGVEVERINAHHNYTAPERHADKDVWLTRKGAIDSVWSAYRNNAVNDSAGTPR